MAFSLNLLFYALEDATIVVSNEYVSSLVKLTLRTIFLEKGGVRHSAGIIIGLWLDTNER